MSPEVVWPVAALLSAAVLAQWLCIRHLTQPRQEQPLDVRRPTFNDPISRKKRGEED